MTAPTVRPAIPGDEVRIKQIAVANGMFDADEVDVFDQLLDGFFDGSMESHEWLVAEHGERAVGGADVAPEPSGHHVWNLYFLAVAPEAHGTGAGSVLLRHVEAMLREQAPNTLR